MSFNLFSTRGYLGVGRPHEKVTREKINRIYNAACMFMDEFGLYDLNTQIDLICVYLERNSSKGHSKGHSYRIEYFENISF